MDVLLVARDPDRAEAVEAALASAGHRVTVLPRGFDSAARALASADAVVADFTEDAANAAWCVAFVLARGRLAVAVAEDRATLPSLVRENPSPYQRVVVGDLKAIRRDVADLFAE